MKALLLAVLGAVLFGGSFFLGLAAASRANLREVMREAGLNKDTGKLYGRAAKILNRLAQTHDLDGAYAGDVLSEETKKQVTEWMADYRKQVNKV